MKLKLVELYKEWLEEDAENEEDTPENYLKFLSYMIQLFTLIEKEQRKLYKEKKKD